MLSFTANVNPESLPGDVGAIRVRVTKALYSSADFRYDVVITFLTAMNPMAVMKLTDGRTAPARGT